MNARQLIETRLGGIEISGTAALADAIKRLHDIQWLAYQEDMLETRQPGAINGLEVKKIGDLFSKLQSQGQSGALAQQVHRLAVAGDAHGALFGLPGALDQRMLGGKVLQQEGFRQLLM